MQRKKRHPKQPSWGSGRVCCSLYCFRAEPLPLGMILLLRCSLFILSSMLWSQPVCSVQTGPKLVGVLACAVFEISAQPSAPSIMNPHPVPSSTLWPGPRRTPPCTSSHTFQPPQQPPFLISVKLLLSTRKQRGRNTSQFIWWNLHNLDTKI